MDAPNGSYMQYNNTNTDDLSHFFNDVEQYANLDSNDQNGFDPALFAENGLAPYSQQQRQPSQPTPTNFDQAQRRPQSQGPALPQFKQVQNPYPASQYGQNNPYSQPSSAQSYDPQLFSRPTPSPGPYDQYAYQPQNMAYGQPQFNYQFNSFQAQRQPPAPQQAFRPQVQQLMKSSSASPQPQPHPSQVQSPNGMNYSYPQPAQQQSHRFIEPNMLDANGQLRPGQAQSTAPLNRPIDTSSPYFAMANASPTAATMDPRALMMQRQYQQQYQQMQGQPPQQQVPVAYGGQLHNFQVQGPQNTTNTAVKPAPGLQIGQDGKVAAGRSNSDDDLEIEEEEDPEPKPAPISISKPADERGKLLWEIVEAVWTPRNKPASGDKIRSGIKFVGDATRNLREKWKAANDQLKQAELPNSATKSQAEGLRATVSLYRGTMETLAGRVTQYGHPSIVQRLGEHQLFLTALYSFLLDRVNAEDYNSTLVKSILKLGTQLQTLDEEQLEKLKWTKILVRFTKKSTNESKTFAQQILNNAKKTTAKKAAGQGPASPSGSSSGQVAGVKRPREGSEPTQQVKKAAVKPSSKPLSVQIAEQRKQKEKEKAAAAKPVKSEKSTTNGAAAAVVPARPKVPAAQPKSSPFASLLSASKKPGTSNAERMAKEKVEVPKSVTVAAPVKKEPLAPKVEPQVTKPVSTTGSSFLGFLADMEKPKDAPKARLEELPDETPEARAKRLRKEGRRQLRVSWKPEAQLVETRIFEHDPDEETGHEDSQMRDVGDTGKEGEMLKNRLDHMEDESDEDSSDDEMEYFMPTDVDFSGVALSTPDDFEEQNFLKTGGKKQPESPATQAQNKNESGKEMTIYAAGEQPSTPKEPTEEEDDDSFEPPLDFGEPTNDKFNIRQREQIVLSRRQSYQPQPPPQPTQSFDLASAISNLYPQANQAQQSNWLHALSQPQPQQHQSQQPAQPQLNLQGIDLSQLMALAAQAQQPQQQTQPQPSYHQPPAAPPLSAPNSANIAAILGQLQQTSSTPLPIGTDSNPNPYPGAAADKKKKDKKKGKTGGAPLGPDGLPVNYKTKVCEFWLQGKCTKGDACTYRHDEG